MRIHLFYMAIFSSLLFYSMNFAFGQINTDSKTIKYACGSIKTSQFISLESAEKIFGKHAFLRDSLCKNSGYYLRYQFNYSTDIQDTINKLRSVLFFGLVQYQQDTAAQTDFAAIIDESKKTSKVETMNNFGGDEAVFISDNLNNPFIMIRNKNVIYKIRVNNCLNQRAGEELKLLAKKIIDSK